MVKVTYLFAGMEYQIKIYLAFLDIKSKQQIYMQVKDFQPSWPSPHQKQDFLTQISEFVKTNKPKYGMREKKSKPDHSW